MDIEDEVAAEIERMFKSLSKDQKAEIDARRERGHSIMMRWLREEKLLSASYPKKLNQMLAYAYFKGLRRIARERARH